jgi:uncharacterized NAD-dependent epimerase/dehydratase family protein
VSAGAAAPLAILTRGLLAESWAKTAHGVLRYAERPVAAVVDARHAGRRSTEVVPFARRDVPVVASVAEARALGAGAVLVGIAPLGGRLDADLRGELLEALALGMDAEAGLHTLLRDDPELVAAAGASGAALRDLRDAPRDLDVPAPGRTRPPGLQVVHTVGTDCAIGKKVTTLELHAAARERGLRSAFVPTGQTGVAIAGWGIAVDHVVADYVAGAGDRLVRDGAARGDLLFVEGQGSVLHPAYAGVTLGLLHGAAPDALVLVHRAGATRIGDYPEVELPPLREVVALVERLAAPVRSARVAAVAVNTGGLDDDAARAAVEEVAGATGLPAGDVARGGAGVVLDAVLAALPARP